MKSKLNTCTDEYKWFGEEIDPFQPGWLNSTANNYSLPIQRAFLYRTSDELDTYNYMGHHGLYGTGGYVYEFRGRLSDLRSNLSELYRLNWIDRQTRAVFIQLSLYNPNVAMFVGATILGEFLPTGSVATSARFEPLSFEGSPSVFYVICAGVYLSFIVYFMVMEVRLLLRLKWKYARETWSWMNWGIIACSWTAVGVYASRYFEMARIADQFRRTHGFVYVNLQLATYMNDLYAFFVGFCCFFGSIKFVHLCRFSRRLSLLTDTLRQARKELLGFLLVFSIIAFAYLSLFHLLFAAKLSSCSNLLNTSRLLVETMLMLASLRDFYEADPWMGPLALALFIFLVVFVCTGMLLTIIGDSFRIVRDQAKAANDEMLAFMMQKFRHWLRKSRRLRAR